MPGSGERDTKENRPAPSLGTTPEYPKERRPIKRPSSDAPQGEIDTWFKKTGVKLGQMSVEERDKITRLLYTYQDLNSIELEDLPPMDVYVHRVRLKKGTPPFSRPRQRRWSPGKEFWLRRIINDGLR